MKISFQWLNEYVDISDFMAKPEALAEKLTAAGLEAESIHNRAKDLNQVVVGKIIELGKHPNAERLTVCQVDAGEGKTRQIVCGAKNHRQGDFVVVALPGAVLPGNFQIKESKIRDVESKGMLCSESELGLKEESEGILILPSGAPVGEPFAKYYGLDDIVLELNVTPNRADCLSHFGLAREVSTLLERPLKAPKTQFKSGKALTQSTVQVQLKASKPCPRYAGRLVKGVKVGPSPDWLKQRLKAIDVNSINNVVDVTNYVMFELGQPLHAFDLKSIRGSKIEINVAQANESFQSFDGSEYKLRGDELTIRDGEKAVALAGIVGGKNSGVSESTVDIFIESAHFAAETVRRTMRRLGIQTDSAYRFSRGTNPDGVLLAMDRAAALIQEVAGGEVASDHYDLYPDKIKGSVIEVSAAYVSQRLGYEVSESDFVAVLKRLGCEVKGSGQLQVTAPSYRGDLSDKTDLVEEYARIRGYDHIPEAFPALCEKPLKHDMSFVSNQQVSEKVAAIGYRQAVNYGFVSEAWQSQVLGSDPAALGSCGLVIASQAVKIQNPLNEDLGVMRLSLLPGLLKNVIHNVRYGNELGRLFEMGQVFGRAEDGAFKEWPRLSLATWGQKVGVWNRDSTRPAVFDLKAAIEQLLESLLITAYQWQTPKVVPSLFHPAQTVALVVEGRPLGLVGSLHPEWADREKLPMSVALAELDFEKLMRGQPRRVKAESIAKFPAVERDLALVMPESMAAADVVREIKKSAGPLLRSVEVFDVFSGGSLAAGTKSVAYRLRLQDPTTTLTEEQIQGVLGAVTKGLSDKLGLQTR